MYLNCGVVNVGPMDTSALPQRFGIHHVTIYHRPPINDKLVIFGFRFGRDQKNDRDKICNCTSGGLLGGWQLGTMNRRHSVSDHGKASGSVPGCAPLSVLFFVE